MDVYFSPEMYMQRTGRNEYMTDRMRKEGKGKETLGTIDPSYSKSDYS